MKNCTQHIKTLWLILLAVFLLVSTLVRRRRQYHPYPPGPPADPILGHLRKLPTHQFEETLHQWAQAYGAVMRIWIPGRTVIVLNSDEAAMDLLHRKSSKFSSRPSFTVLDLMGWGDVTSLLPYGKQLIRHRRMLNHYLYRKRTEDYYPTQLQAARRALKGLLEYPSRYNEVFSRFTTTVIVKVAYGHDVVSDDDEYSRITQGAGDAVNNSGPFGNTAVAFLPFLKYLPKWFPGTYYAEYARHMHPTITRLHDFPYEDVLRKIHEGTAEPSFMTFNIEQMAKMNDQGMDKVRDIKCLSAILYFAGADTSNATLQTLLLLLVLNPQVLRKAQEEIDEIVGPDRLPNFGDRDRLPYVECVVWEAIRWHPILPSGVPHLNTEDEVYKGMFIPKGSFILANARGITLDERVYRRPHDFYPERYLPAPDGHGEPFAIGAFGYGRRICPGRYLALNGIWILTALIISAFNISKAVGPDGKEIEPDMEFSDGIIQVPKHFKFHLTPRTEKARGLVLG